MNNAGSSNVVTICISIIFLSFCLNALAQQPSSTTFTYQGTLTRFGAAVSGTYDFQFILRDAPLNGSAIGTNAVSQVLVTNGLFAATLDYGAGSFPGAPRYLQVGLRTNGSTGTYSVLSPPQPVNPNPYSIQTISATSAALATNALSAANANNATNASALAGYDWSSILVSGNNPVQGQIAGGKIQTAGITSQQIANGAITASQLGPGAVTAASIASGAIGSQQIAKGAVGSLQIAAGGITTDNIADGVITPSKLAAALDFGAKVGLGGLGISATAEGFTSSSLSYVDVPGLSVTNVTGGGPVLLALIQGNLTNSSSFLEVDGNGAINAELEVRFVVNGTPMPPILFLNGEGGRVPPSTFQSICFPAQGTNRFNVQISCGTSGNSLIIRDTCLMVKEF